MCRGMARDTRQQIKVASAPVYVHQCLPTKKGALAPQGSLLKASSAEVEITSAEVVEGKLQLRLNERRGKSESVELQTEKAKSKVEVKPFGIVQHAL